MALPAETQCILVIILRGNLKLSLHTARLPAPTGSRTRSRMTNSLRLNSAEDLYCQLLTSQSYNSFKRIRFRLKWVLIGASWHWRRATPSRRDRESVTRLKPDQGTKLETPQLWPGSPRPGLGLHWQAPGAGSAWLTESCQCTCCSSS